MEDELLPCPFCGSENTDRDFGSGYEGGDASKPFVFPGCMDCGATAESVEKWNTRIALASKPQVTEGELFKLVADILWKRDPETGVYEYQAGEECEVLACTLLQQFEIRWKQ